MIRLLYEYGYTDGIYKDLYRELFGRGGKVLHDPAYEPLEKVLDLIHEAGGVAVLAHPSVYQSMELAEELASEGRIDGVEIDHPRNTPEDRQALHVLAERWNPVSYTHLDVYKRQILSMALMSSWPSQSMEMVMSARSLAVISPARRAFW